MKKSWKRRMFVLVAGLLLVTASCGQKDGDINLVENDKGEEITVNLFGPLGRSDPESGNVSVSAQERTVEMAEEQLGSRMEYRTYMAEDYTEKTYDDVTLERIRSNMDDLYLLNPDTIQVLGEEGLLMDLSGLESIKNLREVVLTANTVNGKLVAVPQEVVAYGLFVNRDMFDQYQLNLPSTPEEFLECCRVFQENGIETPIGANRWWLECFVLAQSYARLYNEDDTKAQVEALNSGELKYSEILRPGFEFLQKMLDEGYIDGKTALTYEAIDGEGPDFLAQKTPIVMAYWGAANSDALYGKPDFSMEVIGFPTDLGQMPVLSISGYGVNVNGKNREEAMKMLDIILSDEALKLYTKINRVISPSKNVEVECIDALKPLNQRINEGVYVLGSNANMKVEQWGNLCLVVRKLLDGASVDDCLAEFDRLQQESLEE